MTAPSPSDLARAVEALEQANRWMQHHRDDNTMETVLECSVCARLSITLVRDYARTILAALRSRDEAIAQAVAAENEACATLCDYECDEWPGNDGSIAARNCSRAIRVRRTDAEGGENA